jgi:hypothetical protein
LDDTAIVSKHVSGQWAGYALTVFTPYGPPANELSFFVEPYTPYSRIYGPNVVNDNWHEAVAMYDGASLSLFLDGILVAQQTPCQYDGFSPANIRIGYYVPGTGDSTFFGDIGEVKIYDGAVPMPEPSTLVLLAISTIGVLGYAWRRRAAKQ